MSWWSLPYALYIFTYLKGRKVGHCYVSEFFSSHWSGNEYAGTWQNQASSLKKRTRSHCWEVLDQVLWHLLVFGMQKRFQWTLMHSPKDTRTEMCPSSEKNFCFEKKENPARNACAWAAVLLFMKVGKVWQEWDWMTTTKSCGTSYNGSAIYGSQHSPGSGTTSVKPGCTTISIICQWSSMMMFCWADFITIKQDSSTQTCDDMHF